MTYKRGGFIPDKMFIAEAGYVPGFPHSREHPTQDLLQIQAWLDEVSYRPGAKLEAVGYADAISVTMRIPVFNTYGPTPRVEFNSAVLHESYEPPSITHFAQGGDRVVTSGAMYGDLVMIGTQWRLEPQHPAAGREAFRAWLRVSLHEWEAHESDEWFKDKATGRPIFDPHLTG